MEKSLLVSQCVRQLDPSSTTNQDQLSILGLNPQQVMELMPSEKVSQKIQNIHLLYILKGKLFSLVLLCCVNVYHMNEMIHRLMILQQYQSDT